MHLIILDCLPSLCQKLSQLVEICQSLIMTKIILFNFLRHGVEKFTICVQILLKIGCNLFYLGENLGYSTSL